MKVTFLGTQGINDKMPNLAQIDMEIKGVRGVVHASQVDGGQSLMLEFNSTMEFAAADSQIRSGKTAGRKIIIKTMYGCFVVGDKFYSTFIITRS